MSELLYKIKKSKLCFATAICCAIILFVDLAMLAFDIIEICFAVKNSAKLSALFVWLNSFSVGINLFMVLAIILITILRKNVTVKSK